MKKLTFDEFVSRSKIAHGDLYSYDMVKFENTKKPVTIICKIHGEFSQLPKTHMNGHGCKKCGGKLVFNTEDFISQSNIIHGFMYTYDKTVYVASDKKVTITCSHHGDFFQEPHVHLKGHGCSRCTNKHNYSTDEFINAANQTHNCRYYYHLTDYTNNNTKVRVICSTHGEFEQNPYLHMNGSGCPDCVSESTASKAVSEMITWLNENNIDYVMEYKIPECKNINPLPFDFYLPKYNILIEYDGKQHFSSTSWGGEDGLKKRVINDQIKTEYCSSNNITLIRIKYDECHISILQEMMRDYNA